MPHSNAESLDDLVGFFEKLQQESPRAAVIIAGAFLDEHLRRLIASFLIDDAKAVDGILGTEDNPDKPASSFSARINLAYCLGLISKRSRDDLNTVRRIRNRFAHKIHNYSFDDKEIIDWCNSLVYAQQLSKLASAPSANHMYRFVAGVASLIVIITTKAREVEKHRLGVLPNTEMVLEERS